MQVLDYDNAISKVAVADEQRRQAYHTPSGKISASMMGKPTLWNVLKMVGVPNKEYEPYLLRKFSRGNQAEDWFVGMMQKAVPFKFGSQMKVKYRDGIGYVDMPEQVINEDGSTRIRPHEVKSVTNMKFKRITKGFPTRNIEPTGEDYAHAIQLAFYNKALESPEGVLHYISSDDLRVASYAIYTKDYEKDIDDEIDAINNALESGKLPEHKAKVEWQDIKDYWDYPEFFGLKAESIERIIEKKYPEAFKKLKGKA